MFLRQSISAFFFFFFMKQPTEGRGKNILFDRKRLLAHLWVSLTDSSSAFAMKDVDAPLTVVLQRRSDGQVVKAVCVKVGQYSQGGPKPPSIGCRTSQKIGLENNNLAKEYRESRLVFKINCTYEINSWNIYQTRQGGNINSSFSVFVHKHGGGDKDYVSIGVAIHVHGANRRSKVFTRLNGTAAKIFTRKWCNTAMTEFIWKCWHTLAWGRGWSSAECQTSGLLLLRLRVDISERQLSPKSLLAFLQLPWSNLKPKSGICIYNNMFTGL